MAVFKSVQVLCNFKIHTNLFVLFIMLNWLLLYRSVFSNFLSLKARRKHQFLLSHSQNFAELNCRNL